MKNLTLAHDIYPDSHRNLASCRPKASVARCNPDKTLQLTCKINELLSQFSKYHPLKKWTSFTLPAKKSSLFVVMETNTTVAIATCQHFHRTEEIIERLNAEIEAEDGLLPPISLENLQQCRLKISFNLSDQIAVQCPAICVEIVSHFSDVEDKGNSSVDFVIFLLVKL